MAERLRVGVAARLSRYLQVLTQAKKMGKDRISSQEIAEYTNINATQIRRDLSAFGKFGKRGVGYNIDSLLAEIRKILRTQGQHNIALVGAGRLGAGDRVLADLRRARHQHRRRLRQRSRQGRPALGGVQVRDYGDLDDDRPRQEHHRRRARGAGRAAQQAADDLVGAGVKIIFNYSEALLDRPATCRCTRILESGRGFTALLPSHRGRWPGRSRSPPPHAPTLPRPAGVDPEWGGRPFIILWTGRAPRSTSPPLPLFFLLLLFSLFPLFFLGRAGGVEALADLDGAGRVVGGVAAADLARARRVGGVLQPSPPIVVPPSIVLSAGPSPPAFPGRP